MILFLKSSNLLSSDKTFWKNLCTTKNYCHELVWNIRKKFDFRTKVLLLGSTHFDQHAVDVPVMPVLPKYCISRDFCSPFLCGCSPELIYSSSEALFQSCRTEGYHRKGCLKRENNAENDGLRKLYCHSYETRHTFLLDNMK